MTDPGTSALEMRLEAIEAALSQLQQVFNDPRITRRFGGPTVRFGVQAEQAQVMRLQAQLAEMQAAENERLKKQVADMEAKAKKDETPAAASEE